MVHLTIISLPFYPQADSYIAQAVTGAQYQSIIQCFKTYSGSSQNHDII